MNFRRTMTAIYTFLGWVSLGFGIADHDKRRILAGAAFLTAAKVYTALIEWRQEQRERAE
jgi:hypothetical protein